MCAHDELCADLVMRSSHEESDGFKREIILHLQNM